MIRNKIAQLLLAPFSMLYGVGVALRDFFYRKGLLKGVEFNVPVISVGNLSVGGAGKSPHIEYLVRLTKDYLNVATLSRGYKRKSRGFVEATTQTNAEQVGDEPLQFKRKYPEVMVTVCESRTFGIPEIMKFRPDTELILLDDAFQHRSVKPGLNILLTEFHHPFTQDYLLPSGRLREWRSAYKRADIIIVTKCPEDIRPDERDQLLKEIQPFAYQRVFFSWYQHLNPYYLLNPQYTTELQKDWDILLVSAIARTDYLVDYLETKVNSVKTLEYADHHYFTNYDISYIKRTFENMPTKKKLILTTEKDAMRLELHKEFFQQNKFPVFVIPVEVRFHFDEGNEFDELARQFLLNFKV